VKLPLRWHRLLAVPLVALGLSLLTLPPAVPVQAHPGLVYGIAVSGVSPWTMDLARQAGLTHVKLTITWAQLQARKSENAKKGK